MRGSARKWIGAVILAFPVLAQAQGPAMQAQRAQELVAAGKVEEAGDLADSEGVLEGSGEVDV